MYQRIQQRVSAASPTRISNLSSYVADETSGTRSVASSEFGKDFVFLVEGGLGARISILAAAVYRF
jgi:hypothetical protein